MLWFYVMFTMTFPIFIDIVLAIIHFRLIHVSCLVSARYCQKCNYFLLRQFQHYNILLYMYIVLNIDIFVYLSWH